MVGTVFVVTVQGNVAHALHWIRTLSTAKLKRHVANLAQHDQWSHMLRTVPGSHHQPDSKSRLVASSVPRKGTNVKSSNADATNHD